MVMLGIESRGFGSWVELCASGYVAIRVSPRVNNFVRNGEQMCQRRFSRTFSSSFFVRIWTDPATLLIRKKNKTDISRNPSSIHVGCHVTNGRTFQPAAQPAATVAAHDRASVHRASTSHRGIFRRDDRGAARDSPERNRRVAPARADEERSIGGRSLPSSRRRARSFVAGHGRTRLPRAARGPTVAS